jgi:hypothetical protein
MIPQLKLQPKQIQAVKLWNDEVTEEILYGGSKGCGKSFLGCAVIFMDAMMFPGTHYFIARHNLNDLKKYTTPSVIEVFNTMNLAFTDYVTYNGQDNILSSVTDQGCFISIVPSGRQIHRIIGSGPYSSLVDGLKRRDRSTPWPSITYPWRWVDGRTHNTN